MTTAPATFGAPPILRHLYLAVSPVNDQEQEWVVSANLEYRICKLDGTYAYERDNKRSAIFLRHGLPTKKAAIIAGITSCLHQLETDGLPREIKIRAQEDVVELLRDVIGLRTKTNDLILQQGYETAKLIEWLNTQNMQVDIHHALPKRLMNTDDWKRKNVSRLAAHGIERAMVKLDDWMAALPKAEPEKLTLTNDQPSTKTREAVQQILNGWKAMKPPTDRELIDLIQAHLQKLGITQAQLSRQLGEHVNWLSARVNYTKRTGNLSLKDRSLLLKVLEAPNADAVLSTVTPKEIPMTLPAILVEEAPTKTTPRFQLKTIRKIEGVLASGHTLAIIDDGRQTVLTINTTSIEGRGNILAIAEAIQTFFQS